MKGRRGNLAGWLRGNGGKHPPCLPACLPTEWRSTSVTLLEYDNDQCSLQRSAARFSSCCCLQVRPFVRPSVRACLIWLLLLHAWAIGRRETEVGRTYILMTSWVQTDAWSLSSCPAGCCFANCGSWKLPHACTWFMGMTFFLEIRFFICLSTSVWSRAVKLAQNYQP